MHPPVLSAHHLSFTPMRSSTPILLDINLHLGAGEMIGLTGPSGGGKTTLCYCLSGIIPHSLPGELIGEVRVDDHSLSQMRLPDIARHVGLVFQDPETQIFLPRVRNELAFAMENLRTPMGSMQEQVAEVALRLGITALLSRNPNELSGGEQQLVAIGSVMALNPTVLILDEPYAQLDAEGRLRLQAVLREWRAAGNSLVLVDHRPEHLGQADRLLALYDGRLQSPPRWY